MQTDPSSSTSPRPIEKPTFRPLRERNTEHDSMMLAPPVGEDADHDIPEGDDQPELSTVPFEPNAALQWLPAIVNARLFARSLGYSDASYAGSSIVARRSGVHVSAIELQTIFVTTADGQPQEIGKVLPEAVHLSTLKSTETLTAEINSLIQSFYTNAQ